MQKDLLESTVKEVTQQKDEYGNELKALYRFVCT